MIARTLAFLAATGIAVSAQANLVINGGFEPTNPTSNYMAVPGGSTLIPGWTATETGVEWFRDAGIISPDGGYMVDLANLFASAGGIEQTFATTSGAEYIVEFFFGTSTGFGRSGTAEITASAAGLDRSFMTDNFSTTPAFDSFSFGFTAVADSTTLSFVNTQNATQHFAYIDGVSVTLVPAPAPAGLLALAGLGAARRRR